MTTTVRLTNEIKDKIIDRAMANAFADGLKDVRKKLGALATKAYRANYATAAQEKASALSPEEWIARTNSVQIAFYRENNANGTAGGHLTTERNIQVDKALPFRARDTLGYITVRDAAVYATYTELVAQRSEIKATIEKLRTNIRTLVYSAGTIKKLIEVWPEVTPFIPAEAFALKPQLPATLASDINSSLREAGIKVGAVAAPKASRGLVLVAA